MCWHDRDPLLAKAWHGRFPAEMTDEMKPSEASARYIYAKGVFLRPALLNGKTGAMVWKRFSIFQTTFFRRV